MSKLIVSRRRFLTGSALGVSSLVLAGCDQFDFLGQTDNQVRNALERANSLTYHAQRLLGGEQALARTFSESEIRQPQRLPGLSVQQRDAEIRGRVPHHGRCPRVAYRLAGVEQPHEEQQQQRGGENRRHDEADNRPTAQPWSLRPYRRGRLCRRRLHRVCRILHACHAAPLQASGSMPLTANGKPAVRALQETPVSVHAASRGHRDG